MDRYVHFHNRTDPARLKLAFIFVRVERPRRTARTAAVGGETEVNNKLSPGPKQLEDQTQ